MNGVITRYIYDNEDIVAELDGTNTVRATYVHGPGVDEPLARITAGSGVTQFYHADGLGSVTALTDSTGTIAQSYTYDSFGNVLTSPGTVAQPYTYTGRELDLETGLYYYRARYYDPASGRFLQEDPIGFDSGDTNLYAYVRNDPVTFTDPLGLSTVDECIRQANEWYKSCRKAYDLNRRLCVASCHLLFFWNFRLRDACVGSCRGADFYAQRWCQQNYERMVKECKDKDPSNC